MILTIGEKIKQIRQHYKIKQNTFIPYGLTQNYISMIEKNRRPLNEELLTTIYTALMELTDGAVHSLYSFEAFCISDTDQAITWLEQHCSVELGIEHYNEFVHLATKYERLDYLLKLQELIGFHYKYERQFELSNEHFLNAINTSLKLNQNTALLYRQVGFNQIELGQYRESITNLSLSIKQAPPTDTYIKIASNYDLARSYLYLDDYSTALNHVEPVLKQNEHIILKSSAVILQASILRYIGQSAAARGILTDFIDNCFYEDHLSYAYHNLICNCRDDKMYKEALHYSTLALNHEQSDDKKSLLCSSIGILHTELHEYEIALQYLTTHKQNVLIHGNFDHKLDMLQALALSLLKCQQIENLVTFIDELETDRTENLICQTLQLKVKNKLYQYITTAALNHEINLHHYASVLEKLGEESAIS
ncbi:MAG TPA: hypothetical protein DCY20_07750 [Firmicutes bacterium]|nr:hypothetical protein [Bacillota bacterium]